MSCKGVIDTASLGNSVTNCLEKRHHCSEVSMPWRCVSDGIRLEVFAHWQRGPRCWRSTRAFETFHQICASRNSGPILSPAVSSKYSTIIASVILVCLKERLTFVVLHSISVLVLCRVRFRGLPGEALTVPSSQEMEDAEALEEWVQRGDRAIAGFQTSVLCRVLGSSRRTFRKCGQPRRRSFRRKSRGCKAMFWLRALQRGSHFWFYLPF
jgi:hypothetical protein